MWTSIASFALGITKALALALAPLLAGALADLLKKTADKAVAYVKKAADDPSLLSGEARHTWVVNEVKPLVSETAKDYIAPVRDAVINLAVKSAYDSVSK